MNRTEIEAVLRELHNVSGFRVSLRDVNFEEIMAYPEAKLGFCNYLQTKLCGEFEKCRACDIEHAKAALAKGEAMIYKCRHGLIEAIAPLYNFGALTGFLMIGQVRDCQSDMQGFASKLCDMGCGAEEALAISEAIPSVGDEMVKSYLHIMTVCAQFLTLSNAVTTEKPTVGQLTMRYISKKFAERILSFSSFFTISTIVFGL